MAAFLLVLVILLWALRRSRTERIASPVLPALFLGGAPLAVMANNARSFLASSLATYISRAKKAS
jgi:hypothetical protein